MSHDHRPARPGTATLERSAREHRLVMPVSGRRVDTSPGDVLELQLRQLGGSGATWVVTDAPDGVVLERDDHFGPGTRRSGAFSTRLLRFRVVDREGGVLRLLLGRDAYEAYGVLELHVRVGS